MDPGDPDRDGNERRRARRAARDARRRAIRRRRAVALLALAAAAAIGVAASSGGAGRQPSLTAHRRSPAADAGSTGASGATSVSRTAHTTDASRRTRVAQRASAPPPGSLPQTHAFPAGTSAEFRATMASLWAGVVHDSVTAALPAFFPRGAYLQLKAIADAGSDWSGRLVHDYALDLSAAHRLLGRDAARARLAAVNVVPGYGHWVPPGVCANSIGYYEMPNARVVYREDGQERSFGIASMISWRGAWYVVHLGAILRSTDTGQVDAPAVGTGASAYSGTC